MSFVGGTAVQTEPLPTCTVSGCVSLSLSLSLPDELPVAVSDWLGPQGPGEPRLSV